MIDIGIVAIYMVFVLVVGIITGTKVRDLEDYSISKTQYSPFILIAAIFATLVGGGSTMGVSEKVFSTGLVFLFSCVGFVLRDLIIAFFIVPKFDKFKGCLSVGDIMAKFYGRAGKICVGIAGALQSSMYLSMQLAAVGHLLNYFIGLPYHVGILMGVGIVVVYSSFGGIKAVTITDVIQFSVLMVAVPVTFTIGLDLVGGFYGLFTSVPVDKLSFVPSSGDEIRFYSLLLVFVIPYMNPALVQRLLMGRTTQQVKHALIISAVGRLPYYAMVAVLGLVALILEPGLQPDMAFPYLVSHILPVGVKGLAIAGVMAVIMSTADSFLHTAGLLLTHDFIKPIFGDKIDDKTELMLARSTTLIIGLIALAGAVANANIIELNILAYAFWLPAISAPLVFGIFGMVSSVKNFLRSGFLGISTYLIWRWFIYDFTMIESILPAVLVNSMSFFIGIKLERYNSKKKLGTFANTSQSKLKQEKSWFDFLRSKIIKSRSGIFFQEKKQGNFLGFFVARAPFIRFKKIFYFLVEQSTKKVEIFGAPYNLFVLFAIANFCIVPLVFASTSGQVTPVFIVYLRVLSSGISFVLIMKEFWPKQYLKFLPLYWHITLIVCLPYFAICMCLFSSCAVEWVIDLVLTNFILGLLVDWKTYMVSITLSVLFGVISFLFFGDLNQFDPNLGNYPVMVYAIIVSMIVGAIFSRNKEMVLLEKLSTFKALGGTIAHEMRTPLSSIQISAGGLNQYLPALVDGYQKAHDAGLEVSKISRMALESVANAPERMRYTCASTLNIIDMLLLQLKDDDWDAHFSLCAIKDCIDTAINDYSFRSNERDLLQVLHVSDFYFHGNKSLVAHILFNLLRNAFAFIQSEKKGCITIWTSESLTHNHLHFNDTAKGIGQEDLPHVFRHGFSKRSGGSGVGLHYCKRMMETMNGNISVTSEKGKFTEFILSFPKKEL